MDVTKLFLRTLDDLSVSIMSSDNYEILRASHLLRQLFLDEQTLISRVNRSHRLKIRFVVLPQKNEKLTHSDKLNIVNNIANPPSKNDIEECTLDQFLASKVGEVNGKTISVKEVITCFANVGGGVHIGTAHNSTQEQLLKLENRFNPFSSLNYASLILRGIGIRTLCALAPLREAAMKHSRFENAPGASVQIRLAAPEAADGAENYIFDIGIDGSRNRLSLFLDAHRQLCLRYFNSQGEKFILKGEILGTFITNGTPFQLEAGLALLEKEILLSIRVDGCGYFHSISTINTCRLPLQYFVFGSDFRGKAASNAKIYEIAIFERYLTNAERMRVYKSGMMTCDSSIHLQKGCFLHSKDHPNFTSPSPTSGTSK